MYPSLCEDFRTVEWLTCFQSSVVYFVAKQLFTDVAIMTTDAIKSGLTLIFLLLLCLEPSCSVRPSSPPVL